VLDLLELAHLLRAERTNSGPRFRVEARKLVTEPLINASSCDTSAPRNTRTEDLAG
jgi:hypothetical protein